MFSCSRDPPAILTCLMLSERMRNPESPLEPTTANPTLLFVPANDRIPV